MNVVQRIKRVFLLDSLPDVPTDPQASSRPGSAPPQQANPPGSLPQDLRQNLNGRWAVEAPWPGDECNWWIPFTEDDGLTELTFATKAEANSYLYARNLQDHCRVVQIARWTLPPQD